MRALVTGGSKGIGKAIIKMLKKNGIEVISWSRSEGVDLSKEIPKLPNVDILINNFGGGGTWKPLDAPLVMRNNYLVSYLLTINFIAQQKRWGRVITISSIYGKEKGHNPGFTSAKAAQIALMKSLAGTIEGTTFNTICPGHIDVGKPNLNVATSKMGKPEDVANLVEFLISKKADHINGATITVDGGESHSF